MDFSSTAAVYGELEGSAREGSVTRPASPYGRSKLMGEIMVRDAAAALGARAMILRYFNVAGADRAGRTGQSTPRATHLFKAACRIARGDLCELVIHGSDWPTSDGSGVRDYVHVDDVARAHLMALAHLDGQENGETLTVNLGSGAGASVRQIVEAVGRAAGRQIATRVGPRRAGDVAAIVADASLARVVLGRTPRFTIDDMASDALAWERRLASVSERVA